MIPNKWPLDNIASRDYLQKFGETTMLNEECEVGYW